MLHRTLSVRHWPAMIQVLVQGKADRLLCSRVNDDKLGGTDGRQWSFSPLRVDCSLRGLDATLQEGRPEALVV